MSAEEVIAQALDAIPADPRPATLVNRDRATAALTALKRAGYAVIQLPERSGQGWPVEVNQQTGQGLTGCRISWGSMEFNLNPVHAQKLAAALLAAAAEVTS